jgi:hypothetical protein
LELRFEDRRHQPPVAVSTVKKNETVTNTVKCGNPHTL